MRKEAFTRVFKDRIFGEGESLSGPGSSLRATDRIRAEIAGLIAELGVQSLLDIPCGDLEWMKEMQLPGVHYIGADIVDEVVNLARCKIKSSPLQASTETVDFFTLDVCEGPLPKVDLLLIRDCFGHFPDADVMIALETIRASECRWLLTTHFPGRGASVDIERGGWRPLDLRAYPFHLRAPNRVISEGVEGEFADKSLALWKIDTL